MKEADLDGRKAKAVADRPQGYVPPPDQRSGPARGIATRRDRDWLERGLQPDAPQSTKRPALFQQDHIVERSIACVDSARASCQDYGDGARFLGNG